MLRIMLPIGIGMAAISLVACSSQPPPPAQATVAGQTYKNVTAAQLKEMLSAKDFVLVNVHVPYVGELPQTDVFIPYTDIEQNLAKLPAEKDAKIVLYCSSGHMSGIAANTLLRLGYTNIWNLEGGMTGWQNAGYALVQNKQ